MGREHDTVVASVGDDEHQDLDPAVAALQLELATDILHVPESSLSLEHDACPLEDRHRVQCPSVARDR